MNIREEILKQLSKVVEEQAQDRLTDEITDDTELVSFRLDSLAFASLTTSLEDAFGYDPFSLMDFPVYPRNVGELVAIYEEHYQHAE